MRKIGYSSGAVAFGDFREALRLLQSNHLSCIELSALRLSEVIPLVQALPNLDLEMYSYISFHAPSGFSAEEETWLSDLLFTNVPNEWPIIMHPDAIHDHRVWLKFGKRLAIENMDRRKPIGRTASELEIIFQQLPSASLCFDLGHARQCDSSMTEAYLILSQFRDRLVQVHISEVNSESQHDPISYSAKLAFLQVSSLISENVPIIIESRVKESDIHSEVLYALESLSHEEFVMDVQKT